MTTPTFEPTEDALPPEPAPAQAPAPTPAPARPPALRRLLEWVWRGHALTEAEQRLPDLDETQQERTLRARAALELGDRTLDPVDALKAGKGTALACALYREALYWAVLARDSSHQAPDLASALELVPQGALIALLGSDAELTEVEIAATKSSLETWEDSEAAQEQTARRLQRATKALLQAQAAPQQQVSRLLMQRTFRSLVALSIVTLVVVGIALLVRPKHGPDLAAGKPWKESSVFAVCNPQNHECGGSRTVIFFCTQEEDSPWMEIDLGHIQEVSRVEVQNRTDCCEERAVPLAIETSRDGKKWHEVARKTELFSLWNADFDTVKARYVRTRALHRTYLHLERVSVRAY